MIMLIRLMLILCLFEIIVCGAWINNRVNRSSPVIPDVIYDDPLFQQDIQHLATEAEGGGIQEFQLLAEGLMSHGFYGQAEQNYRIVLELDEENHAAQFGLAFCLDRMGRLEESLDAYRKSLELTPSATTPLMSHDHTWYSIGKLHLRAENVEEAERAFRKSQRFSPSDYQLAKILLRKGDFEKSREVIEQALMELPNSLKFLDLQYRAAKQQGVDRQAFLAANQLERSIYLVSLNFNTDYVTPMKERYGLSRQSSRINKLLQDGEMEKFSSLLEEVRLEVEGKRLPGYKTVYLTLAELEIQKQNPKRILDCVEKLKAFGELNADILQFESAAYELQGDLERAAELWERAVLMSPNVILHQKLAGYYDERGEEARRDYHLGHQSLLQTKIEFWSDQIEQARDTIQVATRLIPDEPQVWFYLGQCEWLSGEIDAARGAIEKCLEVDPNHGRAIAMLEHLRQ